MFTPIIQNIRTNWKLSRNRIYAYLLLATFAVLFFVAVFFNHIFVTIYPGEAGVFWSRFSGTDMNFIYEDGLHILAPWNKMYIYDTRVQKSDFMFEALSMDGLPIIFELSVRYYPDRENLPHLHVSVGPRYAEKVVEPEVQANLRKVVAHYIPEEIYTSEGYILQVITQGALGALAERHIVLDNLLIRRMVLPQRIRNAIESKLAQEQISLEYQFRLEREKKEAERKRTEAQGILDFQELVKQGDYFEEYLRFKGIEATLELSRSTNAKVVVIGGGGSQLPLIMNMESAPLTADGMQSQSRNPLESDQPDVYPNTPSENRVPDDRPQSRPFSESLPLPSSETAPNIPSATAPLEPDTTPESDARPHTYREMDLETPPFDSYGPSPYSVSYQGRLSGSLPRVRESGQPYSYSADNDNTSASLSRTPTSRGIVPRMEDAGASAENGGETPTP